MVPNTNQPESELPRWLPTVEIRYTIPVDVSLAVLTRENGSLLSKDPYTKPTVAKPYGRRYYHNVCMTIRREGPSVTILLEPIVESLTTAEMSAAVHLAVTEMSMLDVGLL